MKRFAWKIHFNLSSIGLALMFGTMASCRVMAGDAQSLPETVTMQQLLDITRAKSPRYAALQQRIEAADAGVVAAGVLPNPRLSYGRFDLVSRRNTMYDGNVQQQVIVEVPVLIAGQRGKRIEAAEKKADATAAEIAADSVGLIYEEWLLFVKQLADRQRIAVLDETAQYIEHLSGIVSGRLQAGSASQYDLLRIEIEAKSVETRRETFRNNLSATASDLGVLLGLSGWKPQAQGDLISLNVPTDLDKLWADAEKIHPDIEATRRGEIAANADLARAKRERWPTPSVQVGTVFTDAPYGNTSFAGVAVDLPIFDRGQGTIARANAEKHAAILQYNLAVARTHGELERAVELLIRRRETRSNFERNVIAKLPDLKNMGEASYRLGKGSLLELLDASRSRTETLLTKFDLMQSEIEAELDVLRTSGLLTHMFENQLTKLN
ncbi:TolC family protein [Methylomicrobium sp. Wu6]|uniref:TolC family protein n=1 Tax=Methylomicrobium sp. Wu6 TaxID=3107928 RepID=UPI002DD66E65|nr:TolC family protein [Methylomicrobium sp. Wu6]MEC4749556.1 TolC family protein [Methylomicrobium sp. Wu6]